MNFKIIRKKDKLYVSLEGELDHHNAGIVRENVDIEIKSGKVRELIFDFSELSFMDSSGIGIIMGRYKLMQACGGKVVIMGATDYIQKLMRLSGLENIIEIRKAI